MSGHDLANSRDQAKEHGIGPTAVGRLTRAWAFTNGSAGDTSSFETTPVVDGGCVFIGSGAGVVYAINARSGQLVWKRQLNVPHPGLGGAIVGAAAVKGDKVIEAVNDVAGVFAVALDRPTGAILWQSAPFATAAGDFTNSSPVVADGLVVIGFSPPDGDSTGQGGFALIDADTGSIVKVTPTIPPADQAKGYAGGGLWSTPAFDPTTGYLYWGAGNPDSKTRQHPNTDAILKIDLNRSDPTFGEIVGAYEGNVDQYLSVLEALNQTPACSASDVSSVPYPLDDPACGQIDLDFGASANLFKDAAGTELVGDLQKSGVYHVANATTLTPVWSQLVGASCQSCNAASTAFDGHAIDGVSTPGGSMFSLARDTGSLNWLSPIADGLHFQSTSVADGVAYTVDSNGFLDAIDDATGSTLLRRPILVDAGNSTTAPTASNGVSIAEHTVFVAITSTSSTASSEGSSYFGTSTLPGPGAYVVAYRLPGWRSATSR